MVRTELASGDFFYRDGTIGSDLKTDGGEGKIFRASQGHFKCTVEGSEYLLSAGDVIFTLPDEKITITPGGDAVCSGQLLDISRECVERFVLENGEPPVKPAGERNYIPLIIADKYCFGLIFSQLHEYVRSGKNEAPKMLKLYSDILMLKIREILRYEYFSGELSVKKNIKKITDYINEHIASAINLDSIASYLYLDKSYVCRLFKRETGMTINTYINMSRVSIAKRLIASGVPPRAVCGRCGYNDYSTFYRAFRRHTGMSPEEYRLGRAEHEGE